MSLLNITRRLRSCVVLQSLKSIPTTATRNGRRDYTCSRGSSMTHQWQLNNPDSRSALKVTSKMQPPCLPACFFSTSMPKYSEEEKLIYTGNLSKAIRGVKLFSYTSSGISLCIMPQILKTTLDLQNIAIYAAFFGVIGLFTFVTPVLLHLITRGYVVRLYHNADTDVYTAITYSIFLMEKKTVFHQKQVRIPGVSKMFTTFYGGKMGLLVSPELFNIPYDYNHLMGYDRPFSFDVDDLEGPDKS